MPGVPSSRGCDACRKQKKKCDQVQPSCSRCSRLCIPCIGCGEKRYKFKDESMGLALVPSKRAKARYSPPSPPSNGVSMLVCAFASALQVGDPRFDLTIYGPFFTDIPRRLGRSEALDCAASALTTSLASIHTRQQSMVMYDKYGSALKALRLSLLDPIKARQPETMCAIYLVMICQGWIGRRGDQPANHVDALAHLLNVTVSENWQGEFENSLQITMSVLVTMKSIVNADVKLDPRLLDLVPGYIGPRSPIAEASAVDGLQLRNLANLAAMVKDIENNLPALKAEYQRFKTECLKIGSHLHSMDGDAPFASLPELEAGLARKVHVRYLSCYSSILCLTIMLNTILRKNDPVDQSLVEFSTHMVDECIAVANQSSQYRPLGSSSIPLCLVGAWVITDDDEKISDLEEKLRAREKDFCSARWMDMALYIKKKLHQPQWTEMSMEDFYCEC